MNRLPAPRLVLLVLVAALAALCAAPAPAAAHGGPPLRVGVTRDPDLAALGRLALLHLREGVGFAVVWNEFADEAALRSAVAAGKIDVAVALPAAADLPAPAAGAACAAEQLARVREALRGRWGTEVFLLGAPTGAVPCLRPALLVARGVLEDLRFGILGKETARLAAFTTREDLAAVRDAAGRGGERAAVAAARAVLAAKAKR